MFVDPEAYERFMGRWSRLVAPGLVDRAGLADPEALLDVGSGTGSLTLELHRRWPACSVLGVDPSPSFVEFAAGRVTRDGPVRFQIGDAMDLPLPDGSVDAALSLLVLNFVPDAARAAAEMRRVTRPGGTVVAAVWEYGRGMVMLRTFWDAVLAVDPSAAGRDEALMGLGSEGALAALWSGAGLTDVAEGAVDVTTQFASFEDYWEPFGLGIGPAGDYVATLSPAARDTLRHELARRVGSEAPAFPARARAVVGRVPS